MLGGFSSHLIIFLDMIRKPKVDWPEFLAVKNLRPYYFLVVFLNLIVAGTITIVIWGYNHVEGFKALVTGFGWPAFLQWGLQKLAPVKKRKK